MNSVSFCSFWRAVIIHLEGWQDPGCKQTTYLWNILSSANARHQGDDLPLGVWTMAELGIGVVSACLPTMRPVFLKVFSMFGCSSDEPAQQEAEDSNPSDPSLNFNVQPRPLSPALSKAFSHIGVLGDLETGAEKQSGIGIARLRST